MDHCLREAPEVLEDVVGLLETLAIASRMVSTLPYQSTRSRLVTR